MSKSLLYHGFGIRGYDFQGTRHEKGRVVFIIRQPRDSLSCCCCGSKRVHRRGGRVRRFRHLPIGNRPVFLELEIARVICRDCGELRQVNIPFADGSRTYTRAFGRYVLSLLQSMTTLAVARHLGIGWDLVRSIERERLEKDFARPKLRHVRLIAIDEIAVRKGHRYLTVVLDLESGHVLYVGEGKGENALDAFWRRLRSSRATIEAVATDMSAAYIAAVRGRLPEATLVFDHFHIVKLLNEHLTAFRRQLYREAEDGLQKNVLKGTRWLLLKRPENLDEQRSELTRLEEALELNQPLATAYYLKEDLRQLWDQGDRVLAELFLEDWCRRADVSGIRQLQHFAKTLQTHRNGILAWYDYPISTGPLEGTNNKIKTLKRAAYGYRNLEYFKLKILALHKTQYSLVG